MKYSTGADKDIKKKLKVGTGAEKTPIPASIGLATKKAKSTKPNLGQGSVGDAAWGNIKSEKELKDAKKGESDKAPTTENYKTWVEFMGKHDYSKSYQENYDKKFPVNTGAESDSESEDVKKKLKNVQDKIKMMKK